MQVTVVICTRNPDPTRLERVMEGLRTQTAPPETWDLVLVDNGSIPPLSRVRWSASLQGRILREERAGLFYARLAALAASVSPLIVFIDDDTIPDPDFLRRLTAAFADDPGLVAAGPRIVPDYTVPPPPWVHEFEWALALRDLGPQRLSWSLADQTPMPGFTPIGAGLALRASALPPYFEHARTHEKKIIERSWIGQGRGGNEDKDLVLTLIRAGGRVAYVGDAVLHHIIPPERLTSAYFEKLLPGLGYLWMRTLHAHGLDNRPTFGPAGFLIRAVRAWFAQRAWIRPAPYLRWLSVLGAFRGLRANHRDPVRYPAPRP